jgi:hypothetical protein
MAPKSIVGADREFKVRIVAFGMLLFIGESALIQRWPTSTAVD